MKASAFVFCALSVLFSACSLESSLDRAFFAPDVDIVSPEDGDTFDREGLPIEVVVQIVDDWDLAGDLEAWWLVDGQTASPLALEPDGSAAFTLDPLTLEPGWHTLTVGALDTDGETQATSLQLEITGEPGPRVPEVGDLVVTEILIDPTAVSDELGEFIELQNTSQDALDLTGLVLVDDDIDASDVVGDLVLPAGEFMVICAEQSSGLNGGVTCDATFHWDWSGRGFALSNGGDEVVLEIGAGMVLDRMSYAAGQVTPGKSLSVAPSHADVSGNDYAAAWCAQSPSPGRPNAGC